MKKAYLLPVFLLYFIPSFSQSESFPQSWEGNWKGELLWYPAPNKEARKIMMELRIHPADSAGAWDWQIIYGTEQEDNRPYKLIAKDTSSGHWVIDENNGIVLDQYRIADRFCGAFTVQTSTIVNNYRLTGGRLEVEFYTLSSKPVATTGKGNEDSPFVDSYKIAAYQKAVLERIH